MHVGLRINPTDGRKGGMDYKESMEIAKLLARNGADSIQLTGRTITLMQGYLEGHNPYLDYVNKLSDELDIPIVLGGTMRDSESINNVLNNTKVDFVSMSNLEGMEGKWRQGNINLPDMQQLLQQKRKQML